MTMTNQQQQIVQQLVKELGLSQEVAEKAVSIVRRLDSQSSNSRANPVACSSSVGASCSPSPNIPPQQHQQQPVVASAPLAPVETPSRRERVTDRRKRQRGQCGLNGHDDEDETSSSDDEAAGEETNAKHIMTTTTTTTAPAPAKNNKVGTFPTTKSGKEQFQRELCQLIQENGAPLVVEDVVDHFGFDPTVRNELSHTNLIDPRLEDYATCHKNAVLALPSAEDWETLRTKMRKSDKLQQLLGKDETTKQKMVFSFLAADDFNAFADSIYNEEKGLFKPSISVEKDLRRTELFDGWISNSNGRYFLDRKPIGKTKPVVVVATTDSSSHSRKVNDQAEHNQQQATRRSGLTKQQLAQAQEVESDVEEDDDDEVDSIPSKTSSIHTASSTHTIPLIPTIPEEEFEKAEAEEQEQRQKQQAPRQIRQFGGKSGNPALFYKAQRSSTGSIVKGGKSETGGKSSSKHVSFDPEAAMPTKKRKSKYEDDEVPAWVTAPILFADE